MRAHAIAIFNKKLLLLLTDDNPIQARPNDWNLIGGHGEENETIEDTLLREFEEETTIKPKHYQFLFPLPKAETNLFLVNLSEEEAAKVKLGNEGVELRFFTFDELKKLSLFSLVEDQFPEALEVLKKQLT